MNDPVAMREVGLINLENGDHQTAFRFISKAAELGNANAHSSLAALYRFGHGCEMDPKKELYHMQEAAIGGCPEARCNLGLMEGRKGQFMRAMNHFIIAAKLGHARSLEEVKIGYKCGVVKKEDFTLALRGYQAAVEATKSTLRDAATRAIKSRGVKIRQF